VLRRRPFRDRVHGVAALDHDLTARVYALLGDHDELTRDDVAGALDVARSVAAFHLDKLVEAGLAVVRFARVSGRSGPGAGRTSKLYARSGEEIDVSLPDRRYDLAGAVLAAAVERGGDVRAAMRSEARATGERIGSTTTDKRRSALLRVLEQQGYEPRVERGEIVLVNCPFHALATEHRDLVCGMNLDLLRGLADGMGRDDLEVRLDPEPGRCCVRLR
jgi:predicted ArsR family transcriptional regulator